MTPGTHETEKNILPMKRINVVGTSGSGKTIFSKKLAELLGYPHIEMDKIFWGPSWHWPSDEEFFGKLRTALKEPNWVLDGNYTRTIPIKWESADTVIWLDYSFITTLFQALKRAIKRSVTREELWEGTGNRESFKKSFFSKDSIVLWTLKTHGQVKEKYAAYMTEGKFPNIRFIRLQNHKEAAEFLNELTESLKKEQR